MEHQQLTFVLWQVFINFAREQNETSEQVIFSQQEEWEATNQSKDPKNQVIRILKCRFCVFHNRTEHSIRSKRKSFSQKQHIPSSPDGIHSSHSPNEDNQRTSHSRSNTRKRTDFDERLHHVCSPQHHYAKTNCHVQLSYLPHSRIRTTRF